MVRPLRHGLVSQAALFWLTLSAAAVVGSTSALTYLQSQEPEPQQANAPEQKPEAAVAVAAAVTAEFEQLEQAFVDAYARKDAAAIGALFTEDAEFRNELGEVTAGRAAIVELFQQLFDTAPEAVIEEVLMQNVRTISDTVVLEEGFVTTRLDADADPVVSRYMALLVQGAEGQWQFNTLKDFPNEEQPGPEQLQQLEWLLGEWVSEDSDVRIQTDCSWSEDGNFLIRNYQLQLAGQPLQHGVQRIGWDPVRRQIRSWVFDSAGGFVEGIWRRSDQQWILTQDGYNAEGESASGMAVYTLIDSERLTWQYQGLIVGNEVRPDIEPVLMVRRPPAPSE